MRLAYSFCVLYDFVSHDMFQFKLLFVFFNTSVVHCFHYFDFPIPGGLKAVIYTDTLQTVIMVGGAIVLMALSKYYA